jgi:hypothetical protein
LFCFLIFFLAGWTGASFSCRWTRSSENGHRAGLGTTGGRAAFRWQAAERHGLEWPVWSKAKKEEFHEAKN